MLFHILDLLRIKDWLKNLLIFLPLIFSENLVNSQYYYSLLLTFLIFSLVSSVVYILNDIQDIHYDKNHPIKKNIKPLANGNLSVSFAKKLILFLSVLIFLLLLYENRISFIILLYLLCNISYNYFLKYIPIIDILIISVGYILRIESGSVIINVQSSLLMLCSIFFLSTFIISIKRRKELENSQSNKNIVKFYTVNYLKITNYILCITTIVFYLIYVLIKSYFLIITLPIVVFVFLRYFFLTSNSNKGEHPIDIVIYDWKLFVSCFIYLLIVIYNFL